MEFAIERKAIGPVPIGKVPLAIPSFGLWDTEIVGGVEALSTMPDTLPPPTIPLETLIHERAKLVNQLYILPWRGVLADMVCLAALAKYDRLNLLTIFHSHDIPQEHFQWFRDHDVRTHCCEPMDILPYVSTPVLSTHCGDIIFQIQKDCTPVPSAWLDSTEWEHLERCLGPLTRDFAALGFKSIRQAGWWLRLKHTWRFNSKVLLGQMALSCNGLNLHAWNQCPDFYDSPEIQMWCLAYAQNDFEQQPLIDNFIEYKNQKNMLRLELLPYTEPYVRGSFEIGGPK